MNIKSSIAFATLLWLINPIFSGCSPSSSEVEWGFGEQELQAMLDSVNSTTWEFNNQGQLLEIHFDLSPIEREQAAIHPTFDDGFTWIHSAHACGTTMFFASAQACIDMAMMEVEGTVQIVDSQSQEVLVDHALVTGEFNTSSTTLDSGSLAIWNEDGLFVSLSDYDGNAGLDFVFDTAEW